MRNDGEVSPVDTAQSGPELPGLLAVLIGFSMFMTGATLILTLIGIPFGIPLFVAGLGLMLTPKERKA
jgi:ABC-type sulfate transport system permease component